MKRLFRPETLFFVLTWLGLMVAFPRPRVLTTPVPSGTSKSAKSSWIAASRRLTRLATHSSGQRGGFAATVGSAEVLMALAHRAGGLDAMLLGFAAGVALLYTLIFRRCVQGGMGPILATVIVGGGLAVGVFHYFVRPHMFTIALLGWTMMCIIDYERGRVS